MAFCAIATDTLMGAKKMDFHLIVSKSGYACYVILTKLITKQEQLVIFLQGN